MATALTVACAAPEGPRDIWAESAWTTQQYGDIRDMIGLWNTVAEPYVGFAPINLRGSYKDPDGFNRDQDLNDGRAVIYAIDDLATVEHLRAGVPIGDAYAEGLGEDVVFYRFRYGFADPTFAEYWRQHFRRHVVHELGHWLGLPDNDVPGSIMNGFQGDAETFQPESRYIVPGDINSLCNIYACQR
ncbi:MAG: hypothetical protein PHT12_04535 [Patescibacteria group bacterium]|nr:hypothetical protein [Patescibacteria group bacterium]